MALNQGDEIFEYNPMGHIINMHHIWKVTEDTAIIMVKVPKEKNGKTVYTTETKTFDREPNEDGSLSQHYWKRGKRNRFYIKTPKVHRDLITWQLREHIAQYLKTTTNTELLQKIYREIKDNATKEKETLQRTKELQAEAKARIDQQDKEDEHGSVNSGTGLNIKKPTPAHERKSGPMTKKSIE